MVPEGWTKRSLGEFVSEVVRRDGNGLPVLSVSKDLGILLQTEKFGRIVASEDRSRYKRVRRGEFAYDPMLLWDGSIAQQTRVDEGVVSPAYYVFEVDPTTVDRSFVEQFLTADRMKGHYHAISEGTNQRRRKARFEDFADLEFPLPPLSEQRKIADILSSADDAIAATRTIIEQTKLMKEGLLKDLMTRGIGHTSFKKTEIGEIPEAWDVARLEDVATRGSGHTPSKQFPEYWDGDIKWVSLTDSSALDRVYLSKTEKTITQEGIANSSAVVHPAGTVFVSRDAAIGRSAIAACELAVSQHFIAWRCGSSLNNHFLYYFLQSHKPRLERIAVGTTIKTIGLRYFKRLRLPLPPRPEQNAIADALLTCDRSIWAQESVMCELETVKRGLMQDLLTGRVRVQSA